MMIFALNMMIFNPNFQAHPADPAHPLFIYLAFQAVHAPPEVPKYYVPIYGSHIKDAKRANFAGMLGAMDQGVGNVTAALTEKGLIDEMVIVFTADNGGPTTTGDAVGSRNYPLKGGKHTIWEGGTLATACVWSKLLLGINPDPSVFRLYVFDAVCFVYTCRRLIDLSLIAGTSTLCTPLTGSRLWCSLQVRFYI